ncbi:MAG: 4-(cytidine 5'-diphospho)-2-C-methyl-D-erythritol kinase [Thermoleophilaceae bacterium]
MSITETAPAKVNLVLRVGEPGPGGLHPLCSLFARIGLADEVTVARSERDEVVCPGVEGDNLAGRAIRALREAAGAGVVPPLRVGIVKRIPVAAGLGGGSADAAAALRAANALAGDPLDRYALHELARHLGSDVPSQLAPGHAVVSGAGERVEPVELAPMPLVLIPDREGLATGAVYARLDRMRAGGQAPPPAGLDPEPLRCLAGRPPAHLATRLDNDLQLPALSLRPGLADRLDAVRERGALGALVSGAGPTIFGVFEDRDRAAAAAREIPGALVTEVA